MPTATKPMRKPRTSTSDSTDSTYAIRWAGFRGVQVVSDGLRVRQGLEDTPVAVFAGCEVQGRLPLD
jgi:hypothetical protein